MYVPTHTTFICTGYKEIIDHSADLRLYAFPSKPALVGLWRSLGKSENRCRSTDAPNISPQIAAMKGDIQQWQK